MSDIYDDQEREWYVSKLTTTRTELDGLIKRVEKEAYTIGFIDHTMAIILKEYLQDLKKIRKGLE